jgi:purine-cytosine permease-like protein
MSKESTLTEKLNSINEYEREPVPENKTKNFKSFAGMVMGEHVAGTEFVIGPMFLAYGATSFDVFVGLLIGNVLAVFSWTFLAARTAVKIRTTMFYQLELVGGKITVSIYNIINTLMFAFVVASMIAVSATAVGVPFHMPMIEIGDILPGNWNWVWIVMVVGAVISVVAAFGYDMVSRFANICAPWMPLIFITGAFAVLPQLGVRSFSDFWSVANEKIWTGVPAAGLPKFTIWHVIAFSWLCNTQMHLGLGDTSIYRYAKKWTYGFASALGAFIGHYMAWIASGILCAVALRSISPGVIAYGAVGWAGLITVLIAGWTTANPTMYRAGLALQPVLKKKKRWVLTLIIGSFSTLMACFPGVVTQLLNFLAFYALVVAPVGAIVWTDVYVLPKLGMKSNFAAFGALRINLAVVLAWILAFAICQIWFMFYGIPGMHFFLALPAWIIASVLYILFSKPYQKRYSLKF